MYSKLKSFAITISVIAAVTTSTLSTLAMHPNKSAIGQSTSGDTDIQKTIQKELDDVSFTLKGAQARLGLWIEACGQKKYEYSKLELIINRQLEELRINNPEICAFNPNLIESQARFGGFSKKELLEFEQKKIDEAQKKVDEEQERINKAQQRYNILKEQYEAANRLANGNQD